LNDTDASLPDDDSSGHQVVFTPAARRAIDSLPMQVALAALALIAGDLADNPRRVGKALHAPLEGLHSARRGDYRILYRIGDEIITILDVKHRRDAYRP
jgi:mRNA interferase RelE/StbE